MTAAELFNLAQQGEQDDLRAWVAAQIQGGLTVASIAREIGVGRSLLSQYINGKPGSKNLRSRLMDLRDSREHREVDTAQGETASNDTLSLSKPALTPPSPAIPRINGLFLTEDLRQVLGLCGMCLEDGEIGVVIGPAGVGKTTALKEFCSRESRAVYVRADITMSAKELLLDIATGLGISVDGSRRNMSRQIVRRLREEPTLLIVDEADLIINKDSVKKLEILRGIWDEAKTGLVLAGPPRLATYLVKGPGGRENLAQFYSRIRRAYYMKGVSRDEAAKFLTGLTIDKDAEKYLCAAATAKTSGALRRFTRLLQNTLDLIEPGETITMAIVKEADSLLVSPRSLGLEF